jgi:hypothetical protein
MHRGGVNKTDTAHIAPNDTFKFTPPLGSGEIKLQTTATAVTPFEYRSPNAFAPE